MSVFAPLCLGAFSGSGSATQQSESACWYEISTGASGVSTIIPSGGGTITFTIKTSASCSWTVSAGQDWITVVKGSGAGDGTATVEVKPNSGAIRIGTITVADYHFMVSQAAGSACTFTLSGASVALSGSGATATIQVTAPDGCSWDVNTSTGWITVQGSGSGSGTITITVPPNPTDKERSGAIVVSGIVFPIHQGAGSTPVSCTYTYSGLELLAQLGGSGSLDLIAPPSCDWTVASTVSWITITSPPTGTGNGKITFTVAPNPGGDSRSGSITIGGMTIVVNQEGTGCTYAFPGAEQLLSSIPGAGTLMTFQITAPGACTWAMTSGTGWIEIPVDHAGAGNGTIQFVIAPNTTGAPRTGTITIGGRTFEITQPAEACDFTLSGSLDSTTGGKIAVQAGAACQWHAATDAAWVRIKTTSGTGPGSVDFELTVNNGTSERTAAITIGGREFKIVQPPLSAAQCSYTYSSAALLQSILGSGGAVSIDVGAPPVCSWDVVTSSDWISIDGAASKAGSGTVRILVAPNATGAWRSATLKIAGQTFTVQQASLVPGCTYTLDKAAQITVDSASASITIGITAPPGCPWKADLSTKWLHIDSEVSGAGGGALKLVIDANPGGTSRQGLLTLAGMTVTVAQGARTDSASVSDGGIVNAANMQSAMIARGSIFSIFGVNLGPVQAAMASAFPLLPLLGEVTVTIKQGAVTLEALPLYASAVQINALMPSDAPVGDVEITVTYGGKTATSIAHVVPTSLGLFLATGSHAAAQNWVSETEQPLNTPATPARPEQIVILWGTGLGAIAGAGADTGLPPVGNLPAAIEVTVGGKLAEVLYSGRSGCCAGADAIIIRLPVDVPQGCEVPIQIKAGGSYANPVSISISADGAGCKDEANPGGGPSAVGRKTGLILLVRSTLSTSFLPFVPSISSTVDQAIAHFYEPGPLTVDPLSYPPLGSCRSYRTEAAAGAFESLPGPWKELTGSGFGRELDAGGSLSLAASSGHTYTLPRSFINNGVAAGPYWAMLGMSMSATAPAALVLNPGPVTVRGSGGGEIGPFTAAATLPAAVEWTNRNAIASIDRSSPLPINWTGAGAHHLILISGTVSERKGISGFLCSAAGEDGAFAVPASILGAMPASAKFDPLSSLIVGAIASRDPVTFTAPGLDRGLVIPASLSAKTVTYK